MSRQESQDAYSSKIPVFDGTNYAFWKVRMESYLMSIGVDVWSYVLVDYDVPDVPATDAYGKKLYVNNAKAKNYILFGLSQYELVKVLHCKYSKEVCMKLNQSHEGYDKVKKVKLQTFIMRFENLKMSEEKNMVEYFLRVDDVTNMIRGLTEEVKEYMIAQKVLRSLPMRFNVKVSIIEEMDNLKDLKNQDVLLAWYSHRL